jgi:acyl-CoA synthetase (AMP-forming)/AMP-acid ligase II
MNLAEWLIRTARRVPLAPALLLGNHVIADYAEFARRVTSLAGALRTKLDIMPGDRVAIVMPNRLEYLELFYAAWFAGAAVVPINCKLHAKEAAWIIKDAEAKAVFLTDNAAGSVAPLAGFPGLGALLSIESRDFAALRRVNPMNVAVPAPHAHCAIKEK